MKQWWDSKSDNSTNNWQDEWKGMPEFIQEDMEAFKKVTISFESESDLIKFNQLTGLNVTLRTKGVFFPPKPSELFKYIDEND